MNADTRFKSSLDESEHSHPWSPFNTRNSNYPMLPWSRMQWRQRVSCVLINVVAFGVVLPTLFFAVLLLICVVIEGIATHSEQLDRCKRQAVTPYEYHQCR